MRLLNGRTTAKVLCSEETRIRTMLRAEQGKMAAEVGIVRHYRVGYLLIMLAPVLSIVVLYLLIYVLARVSQNYILIEAAFTGWSISIVALLAIGIVLYLYGYLKRQATNDEAENIMFFSLFLIIWGVLTYFWAAIILTDTIDRSMNPGMSALTIWDYMEFWVWELKGILGVATGFMLIVTSLLQTRARRNQNIQETQIVMS